MTGLFKRLDIALVWKLLVLSQFVIIIALCNTCRNEKKPITVCNNCPSHFVILN